jgi:hypothetical protein
MPFAKLPDHGQSTNQQVDDSNSSSLWPVVIVCRFSGKQTRRTHWIACNLPGDSSPTAGNDKQTLFDDS